jgi:hypothetical protein
VRECEEGHVDVGDRVGIQRSEDAVASPEVRMDTRK